MGNVSRSATPLLPSHFPANVEGKRTYNESAEAGRAAGHLAEMVGRGGLSPTRRTLPQRNYICQRITQAYQVGLIANGNLVQNIRVKVRSIEIFSAFNNCESTAYDLFVLELLKPRPLVRAASRDRVVGPRRGGALRGVQRQKVSEKLT